MHALQGVSLELHRHEVVGLIGPNGAGQVDARQPAQRLRLPDRRAVELDGATITRWSAHRRGRHGLARTFQHSRAFRSLTVRENVEVAALGVGASPRRARARATELLELLGLSRHAEPLPARSRTVTSGGSASPARSRPSRSSCSWTSPPPGCPRRRCPEFAAVVRSVRDDHNAGVLLIDHNMALIMDVCDRIQVLDQGRTLAEGTPDEIRGNLDVAAAYLGESAVHEAERVSERPCSRSTTSRSRYGGVAAVRGLSLEVGRGRSSA